MVSDETAISRLIESQFSALNWNDIRGAEWSSFSAGFRAEAVLYPAKRPAQGRSVGWFINRMVDLRAEGKLTSFSERPLGIKVMVHGNVAVALAGCEMTENGSAVTRDVSAFLFIKDQDQWRIAAQGWDIDET